MTPQLIQVDSYRIDQSEKSILSLRMGGFERF
jgi:hypothetical protein